MVPHCQCTVNDFTEVGVPREICPPVVTGKNDYLSLRRECRTLIQVVLFTNFFKVYQLRFVRSTT